MLRAFSLSLTFHLFALPALACFQGDLYTNLSLSSKWQAVVSPDGERYSIDGVIVRDFSAVATEIKRYVTGPLRVAAAKKPDRFNRIPSQIRVMVAGEGLWLQEHLIEHGFGLVDDRLQHTECFSALHDAEARARENGRGYWASPANRVLDASNPDEMLAKADQFVIVEGRVLASERVGPRIFLNFGQIWREDFTVAVRKRAETALRRRGVNPLALSGVRVQVRGWLTERSGPSIEVGNQFQLLVIPD